MVDRPIWILYPVPSVALNRFALFLATILESLTLTRFHCLPKRSTGASWASTFHCDCIYGSQTQKNSKSMRPSEHSRSSRHVPSWLLDTASLKFSCEPKGKDQLSMQVCTDWLFCLLWKQNGKSKVNKHTCILYLRNIFVNTYRFTYVYIYIYIYESIFKYIYI